LRDQLFWTYINDKQCVSEIAKIIFCLKKFGRGYGFFWPTREVHECAPCRANVRFHQTKIWCLFFNKKWFLLSPTHIVCHLYMSKIAGPSNLVPSTRWQKFITFFPRDLLKKKKIAATLCMWCMKIQWWCRFVALTYYNTQQWLW
jgi:hypothetical protein